METRRTLFGLIVKADSSDPGLPASAIPVDTDHFGIAAPHSRELEIYRQVLAFLREPPLQAQIATNVVDAMPDFDSYETAELGRITRDEQPITRTLRRVENDAHPATLETGRLLADFPSGAIVVAPSGIGKTTLSWGLFKQAIEERRGGTRALVPFDVPLPDLEQSGVSLMEFIQQRLSAHLPGLTSASFATTLRDVGATVFCDSFDRTTAGFQKRITAEFSISLRDYPRLQLFVFSRGTLRPDMPLPQLELERLSDEQIRELETAILSDGGAPKFSVVGMMSTTLRSLCANPLLLRLTLEYWKRSQNFPQKIEFLFRSWLDRVLETEPNDTVSKLQREQALTALAQMTATAPIASAVATARLKDQAIPVAVLNELTQCNAVRVTGAVVEVQHEGLADYLRAKAFVATSETEQLRDIPTLPMPVDSIFPGLAHGATPQPSAPVRGVEAPVGGPHQRLSRRFALSF